MERWGTKVGGAELGLGVQPGKGRATEDGLNTGKGLQESKTQEWEELVQWAKGTDLARATLRTGLCPGGRVQCEGLGRRIFAWLVDSDRLDLIMH